MKIRRTMQAAIVTSSLLVSASTVFMPGTIIATEPPRDTIEKLFRQADRDDDQKISLDEFQFGQKPTKSIERDFLLCDFDQDGTLSLAEFPTARFLSEPSKRGTIPDEFSFFVEESLTALDRQFDDWDQHPDQTVEVKKFVYTISEQFEKLGELIYWPSYEQADPDGSGAVSRAEAKRFVEIGMGVRATDGTLLRLPNGLVVNQTRFLLADENRDGLLNRREYDDLSPNGDLRDGPFTTLDAAHYGTVSFAEWQNKSPQAFHDPILEFCRLDTNLDARVDAAELATGTVDSLKPLAKGVFPGFDRNKDGVLSLAEYRTTMLANPVLPWHFPLHDKNGDGGLNLDEFYFDHARQGFFLRLYYFQRLDLDASGSLSADEWTYRLKQPNEFIRMNADGTGWKTFFRDEKCPAIRSPKITSDGRRIAFHQWLDPNYRTPVVAEITADGASTKKWSDGSYPSWSPDGTSLVCSHQNQEPEIWNYQRNDDGQLVVKRLTVGWGPQWSPTGQHIAFMHGSSLWTITPETGELICLLDDPELFGEIRWDMAWSPDSRQICFYGITPKERKLVVAIFDRDRKAVRIRVPASSRPRTHGAIAWHPTQNRVVVSLWCHPRNAMHLYEFDPTNDDAPKLVAGQDPTRNNTDACWTPDGKQLIIVSGDY